MADLLATVTGGLLAISGGFVAKYFADRREERSIKSAFVGELRALKTLVDRQRLIDRIDERIKKIEAEGKASFFQVNIVPTYNTVFLANASKLGLLRRPLPEQIVGIYSHMAAVVETIEITKRAREDEKKSQLSGSLSNPAACLQFHRNLKELMDETYELLIQGINELERITPSWQSSL
jgi:hypothetical protein